LIGKSALEAALIVKSYIQNFGSEDALPPPLPSSSKRWNGSLKFDDKMEDFIASDSDSGSDDDYNKKKSKQLEEPPANTFIMLVGPSGAGKSSIIQAVCACFLMSRSRMNVILLF
jgi:chromosomal replication initiation ATPase DnaA